MKVVMLSAMVFKDGSAVSPRQIVNFEDEVCGQNLIDNNLAVLIEEPEEIPVKKPRKKKVTE